MTPCTARIASLPALMLLSSQALAETATVESPGVSGAAMLQAFLGLTLVIGILFLAAYMLRKLNGGRGFGSSGPLRVVGGLMIGPRERIVLIEIGDEWLVVGLAPGQIQTLHTLPKGPLPDSVNSERNFSGWLKQIVERRNESA